MVYGNPSLELTWIRILPTMCLEKQFELHAIGFKNSANGLCYGNLCSPKLYLFVSKVHSIRTPHQNHIDVKTSRIWKHHRKTSLKTPHRRPHFFPHRHSIKSGLHFVNVLRTQSETYFPILIENNRNH